MLGASRVLNVGPRRLLRLLQVSLARGERMDLHDVLRVQRRVWPGDLDELRHVNNGVYLSMLAYIQGRFLRRGSGVVPMAEVGAVVGIDIGAHPAPAWLHDWARAVALPSTRQPAPSDWS